MSICRRPGGLGPVAPNRSFDLTPCFEDAVSSTLYALFVIAALIRVILLSKSKKLDRGRKSLTFLWLKEATLLLAAGFSVADSVLTRSTEQTWDPLTVGRLVLQTLALLLAAALTSQEHLKTRISSTALLLFYPVYFLQEAVRLRSWVIAQEPRDFLLFGIRAAIPVLTLIAYLLECQSPELKDGAIQLDMPEKESPLATANIYSRWIFEWITPLMKLGARKFITEDDLDGLLSRDASAELGRKLDSAMRKHPKSLWLALASAYGSPYAAAAALKFAQDALAFLQPQLLRWLLSFIAAYQSARQAGAPTPNPLEGVVAALLMAAASVAQSITLHQYFQLVFVTGMRVRAGLITSIYQKALMLSSNERNTRASGDIVNLMSVDTTRMQDLCTYALISISGPFQIALAFISLYNLLGWPAFVGVAIMIVSIPLNTIIARYLKGLQQTQMKYRDERTRLMSELLSNIKSVKLYAWEPAFLRRILGVRNDRELKMLRKIGIATALNTTLWTGIPLLVAFSSFAVAAAVGSSTLTSAVIFPAISLFMLLQFPLAMFSQVTSNIIEAIVSVKRLKDFLDAEELQHDSRTTIKSPHKGSKKGDSVVIIEDGEFSWSNTDKQATLYGVNLHIKMGELHGILGRVGSGKSSLLSAIIGEMRKQSGKVIVTDSLAYVPQNPWIQSATIRDNILFSHEYDEEFYNLVLDVCALRDDLQLFKDGDMTEVGEKGITLSGGQRARIALARAVYARADLYLLDDVLSAVDSHVARHVFDRVIGPRGILSSKAKILVTNTISFCSQFDAISYLRRGVILETGTYADLVSDPESETAKLVLGHGGGASTPGRSGSATPRSPSEGTRVSTPKSSHPSIDEKGFEELLREKLSRRNLSLDKSLLIASGEMPKQGTITTASRKEHSEQGRVKRTVYLEYARAASIWGFVLFFFLIVGNQVTAIAGTYSLRAWGDHNQDIGSEQRISRYLWIYGLLSLASVLFSAGGSILIFVTCTLKSAKDLHDRMLRSILRAPLSFFELTPMGRILNLFSRDIYVIDSILNRVIQSMFRTFIQVIGTLAVIGSSFPLILVAIPPLGYFYYLIMQYYLATSRELKRLDAVSKSPIFAWFSETLAGISTIRGFGQQNVFILGNEGRIDRNQMCYLPSISCNRWLAIRLEFIGSIVIFCTAMFSLWSLLTTGVDSGLVGLVLSYSLNVTSNLNWAVRSGSEVETNIVSVERILHYVNQEPEAADELPQDEQIESWPTAGKVEFRSYSVRYRPELDLVLKEISMTLKPSEKVGVCGRTGAGKSSLLLALFRIIEPASGTILIDDADITTMGLRKLRSAISIIPQEPQVLLYRVERAATKQLQLFEGTMRQNIDPTGQYDDASIWAALGQSYLREYVESLDGGLDAQVGEGGSSMSAGQRQLLCFARALLRKSRVLVLDEATSAVDLETDRAIQEIIRGPAFAAVTMLTIAHRLNTIMEYDRVLVLDAGKIGELDSPRALLANEKSMFYSLAAEAGLVGERDSK